MSAARTDQIRRIRADKIAVTLPIWEQYLPLTLEGPDRDTLARLAVDILRNAQQLAQSAGCRLTDFSGQQRRLPPGGGR